MQQAISELLDADVGEVRLNEPLAPHTTWKIGGPADMLVIPHTKDQLVNLVKLLHRHGEPFFVLGRGSNLLVSDKGIRGVVVKLGKALEYARFEKNIVYAGAAFSFIKLSALAAKRGLTGLEFAGGIPGSVGGAVFMNAGAHGSDVSRILKQVEVLLPDGETVVWTNDDMRYGYRHSVLQERPGIVTEAVFVLQPGDRAAIDQAMAANKDRRLRTQPLQLACAGSVFRNPPGDHAARLIEQAGLKGMRVGGAEVSTLHANFIVNTGDATAEDVLTLIRNIQAIIYETYRVKLETEVRFAGER